MRLSPQNVYAFDINGTFMNKTWGGRSPGSGTDQPHGKFSTNHGCTYDPRIPEENIIIVSDRANMRFEFFNYDPNGFETFAYNRTVDFAAMMGPSTLPCNIRMYPEQEGRAIVPDLSGPVAVLDNTNTVISVVNVSVLLAKEQHKCVRGGESGSCRRQWRCACAFFCMCEWRRILVHAPPSSCAPPSSWSP